MLLFPDKEKPNWHSDIWHCYFNREEAGNCFEFCFNVSKRRLLFQFPVNGQVDWTIGACTLCIIKCIYFINYGPVQKTFSTAAVLEKSIPPLHIHVKLNGSEPQ